MRVTTLLAGRKVKDVETQANLLFDRLKPLKILEESLSRNLSEIKLLINQARKQAASIKVAVSADRDCIRAYQPQISSTNYNTLTLNVKTREPDNLLFYLGSSTSSDFLAVEMRRGNVAFLWDMGSGSARVEFPDFRIDDNQWHSIHVSRFGNTGSLSVKEMSSTQKPPTKTSKSPGTADVLDINNSTLMFVGGLGGQIKKSPAVKVTHFKGCIGEAFLNGKSIGLWNYIEKEGKCHGCFGSSGGYKSEIKVSAGLLHFEGCERQPVPCTQLQVPSDFCAGCLHVLPYRKGVSSKSYVGCIKNLEISRSTFDLLRNSYGVRKGCVLEPIRSVSFLKGGYVELPPKSLSPDSELLATFATKNSSGVILVALGGGSEQQGRRQARVPFFSIMLIDGHVEVHVNSGDGTSLRKALLHAPTGTYGDGREHSISLVRNRRIITVQLDETNSVEMKLGPLAESRTINVSHLYVGGMPEAEGTSMFKMRSSFHGCIRNLIFNMELLDFTSAVGYEQVDLDTCVRSERLRLALHGEDHDLLPESLGPPSPEQCAVDTAPEYVPSAHQFGLMQNSHFVLPFNQSAVRKK
ncbi:PREDICTED: laminin subunit alpha-1-like [Galeopterus variegatus]|uniref:Laminin subunit alpha-1-like n=1 Tax=Galeopterus variegatus TaxID=482537 RepID=A0ABM0S9D7_GALVR|nr:PREDICTED: laminin subunit alpha-1-like [Galeopterus variegatus]